MNTPASTPALSTSGLNKRFGSLVVANEIGIALPQGVRYALIGPNGAGKTTLINLMTGMLRPDGGHILLGGEDITALGPEAAGQPRAGAHLPDQQPVPASQPAGSRDACGVRAREDLARPFGAPPPTIAPRSTRPTTFSNR